MLTILCAKRRLIGTHSIFDLHLCKTHSHPDPFRGSASTGYREDFNRVDIRTTFHNLSDTESVHDHLHASLSKATFAERLVVAEAVISRHPNENEVICQLCLLMKTGDFIDCSSAARDAQQAIKVAVKRATKITSKTKSRIGGVRSSVVFGSKKPGVHNVPEMNVPEMNVTDMNVTDMSADGA